MSELKLTTRIWERGQWGAHEKVQVFQNGGLAGILVVDAEHAERVVEAIANAPTLLAQRDRLLETCVETLAGLEANDLLPFAQERLRIDIAEAENPSE